MNIRQHKTIKKNGVYNAVGIVLSSLLENTHFSSEKNKIPIELNKYFDYSFRKQVLFNCRYKILHNPHTIKNIETP